MKVHVICCNDSVEYAVVNDESRAKDKMTEMSDDYWNRNKGMLNCTREEYEKRMFWHIHTVSGE